MFEANIVVGSLRRMGALSWARWLHRESRKPNSTTQFKHAKNMGNPYQKPRFTSRIVFCNVYVPMRPNNSFFPIELTVGLHDNVIIA